MTIVQYSSFLVISIRISFQQAGSKEDYLDLGVLLSSPEIGSQFFNLVQV